MKKLNITKEQFEKSKYFNKKYGKLEFVSESGKLFKTEKGKIVKFLKESFNIDDYNDRPEKNRPKYDIGEYVELTDEFFFNCDGNTMSDIADTGWMVEDVREGDEDGEWEYYISHDNPWGKDEDEDSDRSIGYWVYDGEIQKERGRKTRKTPKFLKESCDEKEDIFESNHTELIPREKRKSSEKFNRFFKKLYAMNNGDDGEHTDRATRMEHPYDNVSVIFVDMLELGHEDEPEVVPHLRKVRSYIIKTAEENGWHWTYERFGMSVEFIITEDLDEEQLEKADESAMPLNGDQETGTMLKVNDLVSKAYASLYDELKKAGIDFDSASDDGFYVNDPDAQKTYFINLYVNECEEYEGSYK